MKLEFRLLGDLAVFADGHPLELGGTRQRSVLALLLLQRDRTIATEILADRLWQDEQPDSAIKTIQVYVARIRRALGPNANRIISSPTGYRLTVTADEVDAARFEGGLREAREALAAGSTETASRKLEEILSLWSGPALGDLVNEPFARREAERLEELRFQASEELFELRIASGPGRETIGEIRRLLTDQPARERLWRLLMLALYADGRQAEALEAYQEARRYLADELGLDPGPELQDLQRAILTQEAPRPVSDRVASTHETPPASRRSRRVVTVLRAEIARSSNDGLDPEILESLDRRAADIVSRAIERHGGTIDRVDHEGVTAVFGLTVAREDDALRAVRAASELRVDPAQDEGSAGIVFRVGIATGEVLAGSHDALGSRLTGAPLQVAAGLASRASPREVLLASETEGLVRGATSTEQVSLKPDNDAAAPLAVRLINLTDGEAIIRQATTPFVGRVAELEALGAAFERVVAQGVPGLVTVMGAPGVGKSRLVAESFAQLSNRARILRSRCLPYGDGITYWPVRDLVTAACGISLGDPGEEILSKLDAIVGGLDRGDRVRSAIASIVAGAGEPVPTEEMRWAVRRFFETLAADGPLVLLVDDLQWAEPVLAELLEHIIDLGRGPIHLVTVARPELEDLRPEWMTRSSLHLVRLEALGNADAATLLDHLAPAWHRGALRSRILAAAEGNPLFVEQFVAFVSDEVDTADRGRAAWSAADLPIPPTIGALLAARLDRLPDAERRTLERAAVIGRTFWAGALAELLPDAGLAEQPTRLARLARRNLIRPERSDFPDDEAYRFRHLLIRDAAYASLPKRERAELHERFADWLERRSEANPGEYDLIIGYHLEQAYRYRMELGEGGPVVRRLADRALQLIGPAGQAAEERFDVHAAISLLRRAIDLAPRGHDRIGLLISLRAALHVAGESEASAAAYAETVALLADFPDKGLEYRHQLSEGLWSDGPAADAKAAYAFYESVGDGMGMVRALEFMVMSGDRPFAQRMDLVDRANELAVSLGRPNRSATLNGRLAWQFYYSPLPVPDALAWLRRALETAGENGFSRALILMELGRFEAMTDVGDAWRRHFEEAKTIIDDLGLLIPIGAAAYPKKLGATEVVCGEPTRILDFLVESCSTLDHLGDPMVGHLATLAATTAEAFHAAGRLDDAEHYASWAMDLAESSDEHADWRMAMSRVRSTQGRHAEAVTLAREALDLVRSNEIEDLVDQRRAHLSLANALRGAGDEPASVAAAHEARHLAAAKQDQAALRRIDAFLDG